MKTLLWLDDVRDPHTNDWLNFSPIGKDVEVYWAHDYLEFVKILGQIGVPDGVCFDHDLADGYDGATCARYLCALCQELDVDIPKYNMQSANPVGRENIQSIMDSYHKIFAMNH